MAKFEDDRAFEEAEEFLDHFLEETTALRVSTENSLDELKQIGGRKFPAESSIGDKLSILRETLEQLAHALSSKLELVNSFVRDGTDVIDGRLALTTRVLSERCDEIAVSLAQLSNDVARLGDQLKEQQLSALAPGGEPDFEGLEISGRIEDAVSGIRRAVDETNLNAARNLAEIDARLAKIEVSLNSPPGRSGVWLKIAAAVVLPLLLATGLAIAWTRYR